MRNCLCVISLLLLTIVSTAQDLNSALDLFKNNKRKEAASELTKLASDKSETALQALLALTILEIDNGNTNKAFEYFSQFAKQHPEPYAYAYALWNKGVFTVTDKNLKKELTNFMQAILKDPKANQTIKGKAAEFLARQYKNANKADDSEKYFGYLNDVKNWTALGVFENVSASGFNKDFGVLAHPEPTYTFKNNIGTDVKWFRVADSRDDRWFDFQYHFITGNSLVYAQTFLQSNDAKEVILNLGVSGSVKFWINDFPVINEAEERNTDFDVYNTVVRLKKGYNRLLIQLGSSDITSANFMLRFTDLQGQPVTDLSTTYDVQPYEKETGYALKNIPMFAESYFEKKLADKTASFLDKLMLGSVYNHNDKSFESRRITNELLKEAPNSTVVMEAAIESYNRDNNNTDMTRMIESLKANDPESLISLMYKYNDAMDKEEYEEAQAELNKRIELYGENEDTELKNITLMARKKDVEKMLKQIDVAFEKYPDNVSFVTMKYKIQQDVYKDPSKAESILASYLKSHYNEELMEVFINDKLNINKKDEGLNLFKKLIDSKPHATMRYSNLADKYFAYGEYQTAISWLNKALDRAPYVGSMHYSKGLMFEAAGKKEEAISSFKQAVQYAPTNYDARRKLRELEGKKALFENFTKSDIVALYKSSPKASDYPNDNSIYLLKEVQQVIYNENGASEEKHDYLIKVFNQSGIDDWKEISITYNSYTQRMVLDKAELLKKDGTKVQADVNDNQVVFSSLEVGDAIHVSYKIETSTTGKLSEHFWEEFSFNGGYPVKIARYSLLVPASRKFTYKMYNTDLKPEEKETDSNYKLYVWQTTDNKRIEGESNMPVYTDIMQRVVVTSIPDWNYVANWYSDLSNIKSKADFEIKEKVKELFAGKNNLTELQKTKLIYNYIEENFNYSDVSFLHSALTPQRASRTLNSRLGDCKDLATLFVSMCREAGLDANLVLVDTRDEGDNNLDLPTIGFNHCIAQLHTGNKNYFVELTDNSLPFGAMSPKLINANGLLIPKDGTHTNNATLIKLNTSNRTMNTIDRFTTMEIKENTAEIKRHNKRAGWQTSTTRNGYRDLSEEDTKKSMTNDLSNEFGSAVKLNSINFTALNELSDSLVMEYSFSVPNYTSEIAGMKIIKLPWTDAFGSLQMVAMEKRTFPINLWDFSSTPYDREIMTIVLPAGKKPVEIPKNVSISCPSLTYKLNYDVSKPGKLIVTRELNYLKEYVPVSEFEEFKNVLKKISEADKQQIAVK